MVFSSDECLVPALANRRRPELPGCRHWPFSWPITPPRQRPRWWLQPSAAGSCACARPRRGRRGWPRPQGWRRARCRRRRTRRGRLVIMVRKSTVTVPQRLTLRSGAPNRAGRSSGSKPSALITRSASQREAGAVDHLGRLPAGGVGARRDACGGREHRSRRRASPSEGFRARTARRTRRPLPRRCAPRAASPACWPGRGGRGTSPTWRPGGPRCGRSPWRCRRRRSRPRACRRRSARRLSKSGTASPRPCAVAGGQVVQRRHDAAESANRAPAGRAPCRRRWRSGRRHALARSSAQRGVAAHFEVEMEDRRRSSASSSTRRSTTSFSSLKPGMP